MRLCKGKLSNKGTHPSDPHAGVVPAASERKGISDICKENYENAVAV